MPKTPTKMWLLLILSAVLFASPASAWTFVQKKTIAGPATCSPTCTVAFDAATTPGNLVVIVAQWPDSAKAIGSCSGNAATGWTVVTGSLVQNATLNRSAEICFGIADGGTSNSITWTPSGGFVYWAVAFEYSGNATSSVLDQSAGLASTSTQTDLTAGNVTTDTANELLIVYAACDDAAAPTWSVASGWTSIRHSGTSTYNAMSDYLGFTPAGSTALHVTAGTACTYVATGATFRPLATNSKRLLLLGVY